MSGLLLADTLLGRNGHLPLNRLDQFLSLKKEGGSDGHFAQFFQSLPVLSRLKQILTRLEVRPGLPLPNPGEDVFGVAQCGG